jgi:hypothetical protein
MIIVIVVCRRGAGARRRLTSSALPATRNRPPTGRSPCRVTCSANRAPCAIPARNTGHDSAAPRTSRCELSAERNSTSSRSGSRSGGRIACQAPFQPLGNTVVIPAAGARLTRPDRRAMARPSIPVPCSTMSSGAWTRPRCPGVRRARASQKDRRIPATLIDPCSRPSSAALAPAAGSASPSVLAPLPFAPRFTPGFHGPKHKLRLHCELALSGDLIGPYPAKPGIRQRAWAVGQA